MPGVVTASYLVEWKPAGSWVDITSSVLTVPSVSAATTGSADQPLAFGDSAERTATVTVLDTLAGAWERTPIRITFTLAGTPSLCFVGLIETRDRNSDGEMTFECKGASAFPQATKGYSPLFVLKPVATKTTASSVEDPTSGSYAAGPINWLMWTAGGRPYEQAGSYPSASFYYSFDQAVLAPPYSWLAGEDGWAEAQKLVQAAGGQLYQNTAGVVIYRQPFNVVNASPSYTFDESVYGSLQEKTATAELATKVVCSFVPRHARPMQQVTDDTTPRLINTGEAITVAIEPQWPLAELEISPFSFHLKPEHLVITDLAGTITPQSASVGYSHVLTVTAQKIMIVITNNASKPLVLWRVLLRGRPVSAGEAGNVTAGSGTVERSVSDSPYLQTRGDAQRLANLVNLFYGTSRPQRTLAGCVFDPARSVGEIVNLSNTRLSISGAHVITSIDIEETGAGASYVLAPCSDLPTLDSFFIVGSTSYTGLTRRVGY